MVQIIEQKMTGLDRMLYMQSTSDSSGSGAITLTFAPGTDPDLAWSKVQNKLQLAMPMLPETVQRQGVSVSKSTRNTCPWLAHLRQGRGDPGGPDGLCHFADPKLAGPCSWGRGGGSFLVPSTHAWLDPNKLTQYNT